MKKKNETIAVLATVLAVFCIYLAFYERIPCRPSQAGFWIILALGVSIGVAIRTLIKRPSK